MGDTKRAGTIGRIACVAIYIWLAIDAGLILISVAAILNGDADTLFAFGAAAIVTVLSLFLCGILVFVWIYRAMSVAHDLTPGLEISPGWAVGWWFVPIASLWKPYQAVKEIWEGSAPHGDTSGGSIIGMWWAAWIGRVLIGAVSAAAGDSNEIAIVFVIIEALAGIASGVLLTIIIQRINRMQAGAIDAGIFY